MPERLKLQTNFCLIFHFLDLKSRYCTPGILASPAAHTQTLDAFVFSNLDYLAGFEIQKFHRPDYHLSQLPELWAKVGDGVKG